MEFYQSSVSQLMSVVSVCTVSVLYVLMDPGKVAFDASIDSYEKEMPLKN
jgi:hypothetical protein